MAHSDSGPAAEPARPEWLAMAHLATPRLEAPSDLPQPGADGWQPLARHQRSGAVAAGAYHPGWARIGWNDAVLVVDFAFVGSSASNRARRLNERTHLLGDVGEIFLQWESGDRYIEIHVTPENQRLQLKWDGRRIEAVRQGRAALEDFVVSDPGWIRSITHVTPTFWSARVVVPAEVVVPGRGRFDRETVLLAAVCRYDYGGHDSPVLSATADFRGRPFHTREAWHRVRF